MLVGVPWNVKVTVGDGSVDLTWNLVNGAQSYRAEWEADAMELTDVDPSAGSYTHASLATDARYHYLITENSRSAAVSALPRPLNTGAPAAVSVAPNEISNTLSWEPVSGASEYRLYWSYVPNVTPSNGTRINLDGSVTTYTHDALDATTSYYYVVTAVIPGFGESGVSVEVGAVPSHQTGLTLTARERQVTLAWTATNSVAITVVPSQVITAGPIPTLPITIRGLSNGRRHAFRVRPVFSGGLGPPSATVYAVPKTATTGVPLHVAIAAGQDVNTITWDAVAGVTDYDVIWSTQNGLGGSERVTGVEFQHPVLTPCTGPVDSCPTYTYQVTAAGNTQSVATVAAHAVNAPPFPPLVTTDASVLITGLKPAGARVTISGVEVVPRNYDTGWRTRVMLDCAAPPCSFAFPIVAVNSEEMKSTETIYQVTRN
ncbi:MAG: hypothetical protein ACOYXR_06590 [Nitrospirota bacterium]